MLGHELAVEQPEPAHLQPRDQPGERYLRGVGAQREHAFPEKRAAQPNAVEAADQFAAVPGLYRMGVAEAMKLGEAALDFAVDPGLVAFRTAADDLGEGTIAGDLEFP